VRNARQILGGARRKLAFVEDIDDFAAMMARAGLSPAFGQPKLR